MKWIEIQTMTPVYCSKGHENAATSLYCQQCGEKLNPPVAKGIYPGVLLGDRYRIVRELGHGGFGRTYLSEDSNRFLELCVLKEFAPQVQGTYALQKASELFEREAGVLYKMQHPQIPRFRELFRVKQEDKGYLFLVQDYVEGQTYRGLLETRKRQGQRFSEPEVTQLMLQILPVLEYIHSLGVIHRDISPDNMILRNSDLVPVLIDFGGVKQVAANAESQFIQAAPGGTPSYATRLGKIGYAPHEQMQLGEVYPHSDLYAMAATVLVLLTGKEPQQLIDGNTMSWNWRREVTLSPSLGGIIDKMLAYRPGDRYQTARDVLQVLGGNPNPSYNPSIPPTQPPSPTTQGTVAVAPGTKSSTAPPPTINHIPGKSNGFLGRIAAVSLIVAVAGGIGWVIGNNIPSKIGKKLFPRPTEKPISKPTKDAEPIPTSKLPPQEQARKNALRDRRQSLGVDYNFFLALVNETFWDKYPNLRGKTLSEDPKDEQLRSQWDKIAAEWLDDLTLLSSEARRRLGSYTVEDRKGWKDEVNEKNLSSRALFDLVDGEFFYQFPQTNKGFINKPIGQVWQGFAFDKVNAIKSGIALKRIVFPPGEIGDRVSGTLRPGEGKVYIAGLTAGQFMKVNLEADPKIQLSVYPPTSDRKALLEDSTNRSWTGTLPQKGFYEFVVVSKASKPLEYRLFLTAENPAPILTPTELPTATPTPKPTESPTNEPTVPQGESPKPEPTLPPSESPKPAPTPSTPASEAEGRGQRAEGRR